MRRALIALTAALIVTAGRPAGADTVPQFKLKKPELTRRVLVKKRLWHLALLPVYHVIWTQVHEGGHAVTAIAYGWTITSYKPYPHVADGHLFFGSVEMKQTLVCPPASGGVLTGGSNKVACHYVGGGVAMFSIAPYITDIVVFAAADILLTTGAVRPGSLGGGLLYVGGMVVPFIDFVYNMFGWNGFDRKGFAQAIGVPSWSVALMAVPIAGVGLWRLYAQGREVFFEARFSKQTEALVTPWAAPNAMGLSLTKRW